MSVNKVAMVSLSRSYVPIAVSLYMPFSKDAANNCSPNCSPGVHAAECYSGHSHSGSLVTGGWHQGSWPQRQSESRSEVVSAFPSLTADRTERIVASWLEALLQRFSVEQLDVVSEQALSLLLQRCQGVSSSDLGNSELLTELKRRIVRLSGAQLDKAFVSMAPDVIDEADAEQIFLAVEGRQLQGVRYQGEVYRLMESFIPSYRLQAYCLGQTLNEQTISYLITRSNERFAVWVNAKALPQRNLSI